MDSVVLLTWYMDLSGLYVKSPTALVLILYWLEYLQSISYDF